MGILSFQGVFPNWLQPAFQRLAGVTVMILTLLLQFTGTSFSQDSLSRSILARPEKIYLQLDGQVYTTDQTIWFKAIVTDPDNLATILSGVLNIELIGPGENVVDKKLVKLEKGIGTGGIQLFENYPVGKYVIRAFTQWNQNFGHEFIFQQYIDVFPAYANKESPIQKITVTERSPGNFWLNAHLLPTLLDTMHAGTLKSYVTVDGKKDSVRIRKSKAGDYLLDFPLPAHSKIGTISFATSNGENAGKTIAFDTSDIDLQFFPESGSLLNGIASKVGFKALGYDGKGRIVEGTIIDKNNKIITSFKGNRFGIGAFIIKPDSREHYYALLKTQDDRSPVKYPLPDVQANGYMLSVRKVDQSFRLIAVAGGQLADSVYVSVKCREHEYFFIKGKLKDGALLLNLPTAPLPEGVIVFTLMDRQHQPAAERIFFNERSDGRLSIALSTDKELYSQREKTSVDINVTDNSGSIKAASISMMVINKGELGSLQYLRENILSYFLMRSELKGNIEDPGYYFNEKNATRSADLDVLMLTQGWRKYNNIKPLFDVLLDPEYGLSVSGSIGGAFSQANKKKGIDLTLMTFDKSVSVATTDSLGRFFFDIKDTYGPKVNFLIQTRNNNGKKKDYTITLDEKATPSIEYHPAIENTDVTIARLAVKHQERKTVDDNYRLSGTTLLQEVVVEAKRYIPEKDKMTEKYGESYVVISGDAIRAKEKKWAYGLYSVLMSEFGNKIQVIRLPQPLGFLYAHVPRSFTLVVIDGIPVVAHEYPLLESLPTSEIISFEVIRSVHNFSALVRQFNPQLPPLMVPTRGSIIAIYTKAGRGLAGATKTLGLSQKSIPGFSAPIEFYAPNYEKMIPDDWIKPDMRALIHWEPDVKTNQDGKAVASFYNADNIGEMVVVVEAISDDGRVGYKEISYGVKAKK